MKVKALETFSGKVSMRKGEIKEISRDEIIQDLMQAGYIEPCTTKKRAKNEGE